MQYLPHSYCHSVTSTLCTTQVIQVSAGLVIYRNVMDRGKRAWNSTNTGMCNWDMDSSYGMLHTYTHTLHKYIHQHTPFHIHTYTVQSYQHTIQLKPTWSTMRLCQEPWMGLHQFSVVISQQYSKQHIKLPLPQMDSNQQNTCKASGITFHTLLAW